MALSLTNKSQDHEDLAFLPAALEIVETPASPTGRAIAATIITAFCLALVWASFGMIDIVASASGKIIPTGRTKVIQPFDAGVVRAIHIHDGQKVKAGEVLIELDPTINEAEVSHLKSDLTAIQLDIARLRAMLSEARDPLVAFNPPKDASPALVTMQRQFLTSQVAEQNAKLAALDRQWAQKEAERASVAATIKKLEAIIPIVQQQVDVRLAAKEFASKLQYLEIYQRLVELQQELLVQKNRLREAEAAVAAIVETRAETVAQQRRDGFAKLAESEQKAAGIAQDLIKSEQRARLQVLTAPVDGIVQQLAVHTVGGVVTPAQTLLVVVPLDSGLQIEAMVQNRDIGFIHAGQDAEIKIDTFNFTKYGLLHGQVLSVSTDAIVRENPQDNTNDKSRGAESTTSEPKGQELVYAARISLDRTRMQVDDQLVNLSPGMAVTVEIKTGARSVMNYLLSPLRRYKQESLRER